jgi:hypothetical protein
MCAYAYASKWGTKCPILEISGMPRNKSHTFDINDLKISGLKNKNEVKAA